MRDADRATHGWNSRARGAVMTSKPSVVLFLLFPVLATSAEPSWEGQTVILARSSVRLEAPAGRDIAPKTAGVAKDLTFQVQKEEKDRFLIDSQRQHG